MWMNDRIHYDAGSESLKKFSAERPGEAESFPCDEDRGDAERALKPWEAFFRRLLAFGASS
jgi:hypothetical protein